VSAAWSITFPKDMRSKGTMLVNGLSLSNASRRR
jgi:hypothetical protein